MSGGTPNVVIGEAIDKTELTGPGMRRVVEALLDPKFMWRTPKGLIKATGLGPLALDQVLRKAVFDGNVVVSNKLDAEGNPTPTPVFALKARIVKNDPAAIRQVLFIGG